MLETNKNQFHQSFKDAAIGIAHLSIKGSFIEANPKFCSDIGLSASQLNASSIYDIISQENTFLMRQELPNLLHGTIKIIKFEQSLSTAPSTVSQKSISVTAAKSPIGEPEFLIVVLEPIGKSQLQETRLRNSAHQMKKIFESISDLVLVCSLDDGIISDINVAPTYPHYKNFHSIVEATTEFFWNHDSSRQWRPVLEEAFSSGEIQTFEYSLTIMGETVWFVASISPMKNQQFLWVARNISDRKKAEQALFEEKKLAQVTLDSIGDAVITVDTQGRITQFNPIAEDITGWENSEVQGQNINDVFQIIHETSGEQLPNPIQLALTDKIPVKRSEPAIFIARNGTEYTIESCAAPILDQSRQIMGAVMIFHDVTYTRALTLQLSWQANHDSLTKLINRRHFDAYLQTILKEVRVSQDTHVLCFLDLDKFKAVNDTCGHAAGDELLCQIVKLFKANIRDSDTLARLGGDEFALLLYQCPLEQAITIAERLCEAVSHHQFSWATHRFNVGVSIGLVQVDGQSPSIDEVIKMADSACYAAKAQGRNRIQVFSQIPEQSHQLSEINRRNRLLKQALNGGKFCLYGQKIMPTIETSDSQPYGCEILLRLQDPQGELMEAKEFLQFAERSKLMTEIDQWVINTLLKELEDQQIRESLGFQHFMINVSGMSLGDPDFLHYLEEIQTQHSELAAYLCFEISETIAIRNLDQTVHFIQTLKPFGCHFALDDFGREMSSFGFLKLLSVDHLKIDGSFIVEMMQDPASQKIIEAINNVGHTLGMQTIAEFVENTTTRQRLNEIGVDYAQGYGIAKPMPLKDLF